MIVKEKEDGVGGGGGVGGPVEAFSKDGGGVAEVGTNRGAWQTYTFDCNALWGCVVGVLVEMARNAYSPLARLCSLIFCAREAFFIC